MQVGRLPGHEGGAEAAGDGCCGDSSPVVCDLEKWRLEPRSTPIRADLGLWRLWSLDLGVGCADLVLGGGSGGNPWPARRPHRRRRLCASFTLLEASVGLLLLPSRPRAQVKASGPLFLATTTFWWRVPPEGVVRGWLEWWWSWVWFEGGMWWPDFINDILLWSRCGGFQPLVRGDWGPCLHAGGRPSAWRFLSLTRGMVSHPFGLL